MHSNLRLIVIAFLCVPALIGLVPSRATAQGGGESALSFADTSTPLAEAKGAHPLSSFGGSDFDRVNLFNGNLSMTFPLASLDGRAGLGVQVVLSYNSKFWRTVKLGDGDPGTLDTQLPITQDWDSTEASLAPGWRINAGSMTARHWGWGTLSTDPCQAYPTTMTTISFIAPDGTEYAFYDKPSGQDGGQPITAAAFCNSCDPQAPDYSAARNRGKIFVTRDGTAATFVSDDNICDVADFAPPDGGTYLSFPSGWVILRDGMRYQVVGGRVVKQQDRNGNFVVFGYDTYGRLTSVTDTLERTITIEYFELSKFADALAEVTVKGTDGADRVTRIEPTQLVDAIRSDYPQSQPTYEELWTNLDEEGSVDLTLVGSIRLPDSHRWNFEYNPYGEVARVETPAHGAIEYDHEHTSLGETFTGTGPQTSVFRRCAARRTYPDKNNSTPESLTTYEDPTLEWNDVTPPAETEVLERRRNPATNDTISIVRHKFYGSPVGDYRGYRGPSGYRNWKYGREFRTERAGYPAPMSALVERNAEDMTWAQRATLSWWMGTADTCPENDPRLTVRTSTVLETGAGQQIVSKVDYGYDTYNNVTSEKSYDFGAPGSSSAGSLLREVTRTYVTSYKGQNYHTNNNIHLRSLLSTELVKDGLAAKETFTEYEYDNYNDQSSDVYHASLESYANSMLPTHNWSAYGATFYYRGNLTKATVKASDVGTELTSTWSQYDIFGNVVKVVAPRAPDPTETLARHTTSIVFTHQPTVPGREFYFAYPTSASRQVTEADGTVQTLNVYVDYFRWTGKVKTVQGYNGVSETTSFEYNDGLDRLTRVVRPSGLGETALVYSAPTDPLSMTERTLQSSGNWIEGTTTYDGLFRVKQQDREDAGPGGVVRILTRYDLLGRLWLVSNPFRPGISAPTDGWTRTLYDDQNRVVKTSSFDNGPASPPSESETSDTGDVVTTYSGPVTTVTDQVSKSRRTKVDSLGRVVTVWEDPAGLNYATTYAYDARGNLTAVTQTDASYGTQSRAFKYDGLSRVLFARMPEQNATISDGAMTWSCKYEYDRASNLKVRTDARGVVVEYKYDEMNRVRTKDYSSTGGSFKDVVYVYDDSALPTSLINGTVSTPPSPYARASAKGRLVAAITNPTSATTETAQELTGVFYGYDAGGRVTSHSQLIEGQHFVSTQTYNLASALDVETYYRPVSGVEQVVSSIDNDYNDAGQLRTVKRTPGGGSAAVISDLMEYTASAALARQRMANSASSYLYHSIDYNSRQQPTSIALGAASGGADKLQLQYDYGLQPTPLDKGGTLDQTKNNGNIGRMGIRPQPGHQGFEQDFEYDSLNRLRIAKEFLGADTPLGAPTSLITSVRSTTQIDLRWVDNSSSETGFAIEWKTGLGGNWTLLTTVGANVRTYPHMGLTANTQYCYRVRAVSGLQASAYSNEACATTSSSACTPTQPAVISGTPLTSECQAIKVDWADSSSNETGFLLERASATTGSNFSRIATLGANVTTFTDRTLDPNAGGTYFYRIKAVNGTCESDYTTSSGVTESPCDYAVLTNGVNSYVQVADSNALDVTGSLTVEAWVRVLESGVNQILISKRKLSSTNSGGYELGVTSGNKLVFATFKNNGTIASIVISSDSVPIGPWVHVAGILQYNQPVGTTKMHVAINGKLRTRNNPGASPNADPGTTSLQMGCVLKPSGNGTLWLKGKIDEVRISNTARYTADFMPVTRFTSTDTATKGLWHMDDASGVTATDTSGNGNGSLINSVEWTGGVQTPLSKQADEGADGKRPSDGATDDLDQGGSARSAEVEGEIAKTQTVPDWTQEFSYDRWGNRTWGGQTSMETPPLTIAYSTASRLKNQMNTVDAQTCQYDTAGNLQIVYEYDLRKTLYYDAENRVWKAEVYNSQSGTTATTIYVYDGEGKRVKQRLGAGDETEDVQRFVYNAVGAIVAEYESLTQAPKREHVYGASGLLSVVDSNATEGIRYLVSDHLGSPRISMKEGLVVASRHDYYPFGEELLSAERRSHADGYLRSDGVRQRFTGKERDTETGLDYFGARHYGSTLGKFLSCDPIPLSKARVYDPQRINLYAYGRNNPLKYIDPTGMEIMTTGTSQDRDRYAADLGAETGLKLKAGNDGKVAFDGDLPDRSKLGEAAGKIYDAITGKETVNINLVQGSGTVDFGTPYSIDGAGNLSTSVQSIDFADIDKANAANLPDFNECTIVLHETMEAVAFQVDGAATFDAAHNAANSLAPGLNASSLKPFQSGPGTVANPLRGPMSGEILVDLTFRGTPTGMPASNGVADIIKWRAVNPIDVTRVYK